MTYRPINDQSKQQWIDWLNNSVKTLDGKAENKSDNAILQTPDGDVANMKDLVGNLLATLTNQTVTIN